MIYSRNKPPKRWPQNENAPYHHDAIGGTEKLTNTSADFTGSRAQHGNIFAPMPGKRAPNFGLALPTTDATLTPWPSACCTGACAGNFARTPKSCAKVRFGFGSPITEGAVAAPSLESGFFTSTYCVWHTQLSFLVGCVGAPAKVRRFLRPVFQPRTVCHHRLEAMAAGLPPVPKEPILANAIPKGHTAPTLKAAPANSHFDPVALHIQAVNALAMAKFYANRHNHAGAARKCVQALSALRQLAAFERVEVQHA